MQMFVYWGVVVWSLGKPAKGTKNMLPLGALFREKYVK
jgi:hypothetical protein